MPKKAVTPKKTATKEKKENKGGRPKIPINKEEFEKLCSLQCTEEEIAGWFSCSLDTIRRYCQNEYKEQFCEVYKRLSAKGKISLRRTQFRIAENGNATMALWLGKQYLGQTDKQDVSIEAERDYTLNIVPASVAVKEMTKGGND